MVIPEGNAVVLTTPSKRGVSYNKTQTCLSSADCPAGLLLSHPQWDQVACALCDPLTQNRNSSQHEVKDPPM